MSFMPNKMNEPIKSSMSPASITRETLSTPDSKSHDIAWSILRTLGGEEALREQGVSINAVNKFLERETKASNFSLGENSPAKILVLSALTKILVEPFLPASKNIPEAITKISEAVGGLGLNLAGLHLDTWLGILTTIAMGATTFPTLFPNSPISPIKTLNKHTMSGVRTWLTQKMLAGEVKFIGDPKHKHTLVIGAGENDAVEEAVSAKTAQNYLAVGKEMVGIARKTGVVSLEGTVTEKDWEKVLHRIDLVNVAEIVVSVNKSADIVLPGPDNVDFTPRELRVFLATCKNFAISNKIDPAELPPIRVLGDLTESVDGLSFEQVLREFSGLSTLGSVDLTKQILDTIKRARRASRIRLVGTSTNQKYQIELDKLQVDSSKASNTVNLVYDETDEKVFATYVSESLTDRNVCALFMTREFAEKARKAVSERLVRRGMQEEDAAEFTSKHIFTTSDLLLAEVAGTAETSILQVKESMLSNLQTVIGKTGLITGRNRYPGPGFAFKNIRKEGIVYETQVSAIQGGGFDIEMHKNVAEKHYFTAVMIDPEGKITVRGKTVANELLQDVGNYREWPIISDQHEATRRVMVAEDLTEPEIWFGENETQKATRTGMP